MFTITMLSIAALGPVASTQVLTSALTAMLFWVLTVWALILSLAGLTATAWVIARALRPARIRESWKAQPRRISEVALAILGNSASVKLAAEVQQTTATATKATGSVEDLNEAVATLAERIATLEQLMHGVVGENGDDNDE